MHDIRFSSMFGAISRSFETRLAAHRLLPFVEPSLVASAC